MKVLPHTLTLLHSEQPKLYGVLAALSAIGLKIKEICFVVVGLIVLLCIKSSNKSFKHV